MTKEKNIDRFNKDVESHNGYKYTNEYRFSSKIANDRISKAILSMTNFKGKRVIDVGCGDGTYSFQLLEAGAKYVVGVDAASKAVEIANKKYSDNKDIEFYVENIYELSAPLVKYDIAVVRGILHHLYDVKSAIKSISKLANTIIVLEPNGFNPILKVIEKISPYHIEHEEKSYAPNFLDKCFLFCGGNVVKYEYIGLVPMFCPVILARILKIIEPLIEKLPLLNKVVCGQYIQLIKFEDR